MTTASISWVGHQAVTTPVITRHLTGLFFLPNVESTRLARTIYQSAIGWRSRSMSRTLRSTRRSREATSPPAIPAECGAARVGFARTSSLANCLVDFAQAGDSRPFENVTMTSTFVKIIQSRKISKRSLLRNPAGQSIMDRYRPASTTDANLIKRGRPRAPSNRGWQFNYPDKSHNSRA